MGAKTVSGLVSSVHRSAVLLLSTVRSFGVARRRRLPTLLPCNRGTVLLAFEAGSDVAVEALFVDATVGNRYASSAIASAVAQLRRNVLWGLFLLYS